MPRRARLPYIFYIILIPQIAFSAKENTLDLAIRFFKRINTSHIFLSTCSKNGNINFMQGLSKQGFQSAALKQANETIMENQLTTLEKIGILMEMQCTNAEALLRLASTKKYFNHRRRWLLVLPTHVNKSKMEELFDKAKPAMFDIKEFFNAEYENMNHRTRMEEINAELNYKVLKELGNERAGPKTNAQDLLTVPGFLRPLTDLEALVDSEVVLAVPQATGAGMDLYMIHRKVNYSSLEVESIGTYGANYLRLPALHIPTSLRRNNFHRSILRAGCGLLHYDYFNRSDELTTKQIDFWAQITFEHLKLLEEMLNFRMLVKCFDDSGWPVNGTFNGMVGFLQRHHADITATGLILHKERMNVIDYVDSTVEFKVGLLMRQPTLASVSNIFVLPFSRAVWMALVGLLLITGVIMFWQMVMERWLHNAEVSVHSGDVFTFLTGAACQQGYPLGIDTVAVRLSVLVVLISSLFLFTAYSATIVALLQSPANFINSVEEFAKSKFRLAIEDLPYMRKFLYEDEHVIIKQLFEEKIKPTGGEAYLNTSEGVRRLRLGQFGFQCELPQAYKLIKETFTEREKCGLNELNLFPNRYLGPGLAKKSPNKEILVVRMRWIKEVGLTHRTLRRWSHSKPPCHSSHTEFNSVGVPDVLPLISIVVGGILLSLGIMLIEFTYHSKETFKNLCNNQSGVVPVKAKKRIKNVWQYNN